MLAPDGHADDVVGLVADEAGDGPGVPRDPDRLFRGRHGMRVRRPIGRREAARPSITAVIFV